MKNISPIPKLANACRESVAKAHRSTLQQTNKISSAKDVLKLNASHALRQSRILHRASLAKKTCENIMPTYANIVDFHKVLATALKQDARIGSLGCYFAWKPCGMFVLVSLFVEVSWKTCKRASQRCLTHILLTCPTNMS